MLYNSYFFTNYDIYELWMFKLIKLYNKLYNIIYINKRVL